MVASQGPYFVGRFEGNDVILDRRGLFSRPIQYQTPEAAEERARGLNSNLAHRLPDDPWKVLKRYEKGFRMMPPTEQTENPVQPIIQPHPETVEYVRLNDTVA